MFGHVWPTYRTRFQQSMVCIPMLCSFSMPFCFFKAWFKPWRSLAIGGDWRPDQVPSEITLRCWAWIWGELSHSSTLQSVMSRPTSLSWQPTEVNKSPCLASFFGKRWINPSTMFTRCVFHVFSRVIFPRSGCRGFFLMTIGPHHPLRFAGDPRASADDPRHLRTGWMKMDQRILYWW